MTQQDILEHYSNGWKFVIKDMQERARLAIQLASESLGIQSKVNSSEVISFCFNLICEKNFEKSGNNVALRKE